VQALRNAVLSYGLMNVPVGVCTAAKRQEKTFKTLHKECLQPISSPKECSACQKSNLSMDELVKGYEFVKHTYVVVDPKVMEEIVPQRSEVIEITKCVEWEHLDEMLIEKSYFLSPPQVFTRPYQLLASALGNKEAVGIGTAALWGKQYPVGVWSRENGVLVMSLLYCHEDVVSDLSVVEQFGLVPDEEQDLANMWVAAMLRPLNPQEDLSTKQRKLRTSTSGH